MKMKKIVRKNSLIFLSWNRVLFSFMNPSLFFLFGLNNVFKCVYIDYNKDNIIIEIQELNYRLKKYKIVTENILRYLI